MSREVMKLALEALYENTQYSMRGDPIAYQDQRNDDIIKTIKAALAQQDHPEQMARLGWQYVECPACGSEGARAFPKPEEEPVAIADGTFNHNCPIGSLLYTSPPQRQPLTDAEIWQMVNDCSFNRDLHADKFARAIEAKLKEKNK